MHLLRPEIRCGIILKWVGSLQMERTVVIDRKPFSAKDGRESDEPPDKGFVRGKDAVKRNRPSRGLKERDW